MDKIFIPLKFIKTLKTFRQSCHHRVNFFSYLIIYFFPTMAWITFKKLVWTFFLHLLYNYTLSPLPKYSLTILYFVSCYRSPWSSSEFEKCALRGNVQDAQTSTSNVKTSNTSKTGNLIYYMYSINEFDMYLCMRL